MKCASHPLSGSLKERLYPCTSLTPFPSPLAPLCGFFSAARTGLNSCNGDHLSHKSENIYNLALYRKSVPTPLLDTQEIDVDWRQNDWINGLQCSHSSSCLVLLAIFICEILRARIESYFPFLAPAQGQQVLTNIDADLLPLTPGNQDVPAGFWDTGTPSWLHQGNPLTLRSSLQMLRSLSPSGQAISAARGDVRPADLLKAPGECCQVSSWT